MSPFSIGFGILSHTHQNHPIIRKPVFTARHVTFGSSPQDNLPANYPSLQSSPMADKIKVLTKNYGLGVTARNVFDLITRLTEQRRFINTQKNEHLKQKYEEQQATYRAKGWFFKLFAKEPTAPTYAKDEYINLEIIYSHYKGDSTLDEARMKALHQAIHDLNGAGLIHIHEPTYYDPYFPEEAEVTLTEEAKAVIHRS